MGKRGWRSESTAVSDIVQHIQIDIIFTHLQRCRKRFFELVLDLKERTQYNRYKDGQLEMSWFGIRVDTNIDEGSNTIHESQEGKIGRKDDGISRYKEEGEGAECGSRSVIVQNLEAFKVDHDEAEILQYSTHDTLHIRCVLHSNVFSELKVSKRRTRKDSLARVDQTSGKCVEVFVCRLRVSNNSACWSTCLQ